MKKLFCLIILPLLFAGHLPAKNMFNNNPTLETHTYKLINDIVWAKPKGFSLTMDIYVPQTGKKSYPVIIIFHGGGWMINNKSIMNDMSKFLAEHSEYIVCNVNYRLLIDNKNTTTMNEIVEDVFGAVLWVKANIRKYGGDSKKIAVTGDSAGGHLAAMVAVQSRDLSSFGFSKEHTTFKPTWLPQGRTAEDIAKAHNLDVQAVIPNYAVYDLYKRVKEGGLETSSFYYWNATGNKARGIFGDSLNIKDNPEYYYAVSPIYNIPDAKDRKLPPQLCTAGSIDQVVPPANVKAYVDSLKAKGQLVEYWEHEGRNHAYLDTNPNFEKDGIPALEKMIQFLDSIFYKK